MQIEIRKAEESDLNEIHGWLVDHDRKGIRENFLCNWEVIKRQAQNADMLIAIESVTSKIIGFMTGGLIDNGVLQVHNDYRSNSSRSYGVGSKLVKFACDEARRNDTPFLWVECAPSSSEEFWKKQGFTIIRKERQHPKGYKVLEDVEQTHSNENQDISEVVISFYDQRALYSASAEPRKKESIKAYLYNDSELKLSKKIYCHRMRTEGDTVIKIEVNGVTKLFGKAKGSEAKEIGVRVTGSGDTRIHKISLDELNT
ncbi:hypothetical protein LNTAR_25485 [Lentisphaera araneosa HTCC2155]|uniref:N-acetyltransferase domain-containing protein n=1 Tax=Lentisphaera araneosa HTCC2155 TaxID=313628 RepID=A6DSD9_9BACT|nr:GNAT family N-acetyltransferase [Lentisphaera araneosa]EDM25484.1 hypothetical protein LNTAR_25485 [Lentisphaera araneosa HTCC2155]